VEVRWRLESSREDKNREWVLRVELSRRVLKRMPNARAYVPYFPKVRSLNLISLALHVWKERELYLKHHMMWTTVIPRGHSIYMLSDLS